MDSCGNLATLIVHFVVKAALLRPCLAVPLSFFVLVFAKRCDGFSDPFEPTDEMIAEDVFKHLPRLRLAANIGCAKLPNLGDSASHDFRQFDREPKINHRHAFFDDEPLLAAGKRPNCNDDPWRLVLRSVPLCLSDPLVLPGRYVLACVNDGPDLFAVDDDSLQDVCATYAPSKEVAPVGWTVSRIP